MNNVILNVNKVSHSFPNGKNRNHVLHDVSIDIVQGQFVSLVGPSGCGKSTLLKAILGTDPPERGGINAEGKPVLGPNRRVGIAYQQYGLYQFLTVEENVAFGPMLDKTNLWHRCFMPWQWWPKRKKQLEEAREILNRFKLGNSLKCYPYELSGGMQQRVALAQALIMKPAILLMDEPFGALDEGTREESQKMLLELYKENLITKKQGGQPPWTVIIVTHELNEAFYVSDRLFALSRNWYEDNGVTRIFGADWGATKVWDKCTPTFSPDAPKDFKIFHDVKEELKRVVLSGKVPPIERNQHVSFWSDLEAGVGTGIVMTRSDYR